MFRYYRNHIRVLEQQRFKKYIAKENTMYVLKCALRKRMQGLHKIVLSEFICKHSFDVIKETLIISHFETHITNVLAVERKFVFGQRFMLTLHP